VIVGIVVRNRGDEPVQIVGVNECCTTAGCIKGVNLPKTVEPHDEVAVELEWHAGMTEIEPFDGLLYTSCPSQPTLPFQLVVHDRPTVQ
jgi:hypothetical protein